MLKEFREFALKGNLVDVAVGLVIGAAFGAIVTSLVDDLVTPVLGLITGGTDFSDQYVVLREGAAPGPYASLAAAREAGANVLAWGRFLTLCVTFLLTALALFAVVRAMNAARNRAQVQAAESPVEPELTADQKLLTEIRDALVRRPLA